MGVRSRCLPASVPGSKRGLAGNCKSMGQFKQSSSYFSWRLYGAVVQYAMVVNFCRGGDQSENREAEHHANLPAIACGERTLTPGSRGSISEAVAIPEQIKIEAGARNRQHQDRNAEDIAVEKVRPIHG